MENATTKENLERAFDFAETNGSGPMRAMAANVMGRMGADATLAELVTAYQNSDGGWHGFDSDLLAPLSAISQIHLGLQSLLWIEPKDGTSLNLTVDFLQQAQHETGWWD